MSFKRFVNAVEVVAVVLALAAVFLLFINEPDDRSSAPGTPETPGAAIYSANCASCHGSAGEGSIGPRLAGTVTESYPDVDDELAVVTDGKDGMPSFGDDLSATQIRQVVDYTRNGLGG
jgi:mono/diheme cytochrome c family protein